MDYGTRLADRNRALFSVKGGKMLFLKRGEAASRR
jgi:phage protein D